MLGADVAGAVGVGEAVAGTGDVVLEVPKFVDGVGGVFLSQAASPRLVATQSEVRTVFSMVSNSETSM